MRARSVASALLAFALALSAGACSRNDSEPRVVVDLDGSARVPDAEGVVRDVDRHHIVLDGGRSYPLSPDLQSFHSKTRAAISVLQRKGEYVQVGVDDGTVVWVAAIGAVVPLDRPTVFYQATITRIADGRVTFDDGTVLRLAPGVDADEGRLVRAELDPATRQVVALVVL
jgi:hypothetical protein